MADGDLLSRPRAGDSHRGNGTTRVVGRPRGLPGSRAVVGGLMVALALVGTFAAYTGATADKRVQFVVAKRQIAPGAMLTRADLTLAAMDLPPQPASRAFTDVSALVGAVLTAPLARGELVQASQVVAKRSGAQGIEVSIPVEAARAVGGHLVAGDTVDVAATYGTGADAFTTTVVAAARILSVDRPSGTLSSNAADVVTLSVRTPTEALAVTHASAAGQVSLIRTTGRPNSTRPPETYRAPRASG